MHWRCFRQSEHARVLLIRSKGQHFFSYIRHFEVARETGSRWLSKCIVGLFWGQNCRHVENASPKTVPQCTLTTILTRSPAQPQSGEYARPSWLGWATLSWDHCIVPTLFERKNWRHIDRFHDIILHHLHDVILLFQAFGISENFPLRYTLARNCNKY